MAGEDGQPPNSPRRQTLFPRILPPARTHARTHTHSLATTLGGARASKAPKKSAASPALVTLAYPHIRQQARPPVRLCVPVPQPLLSSPEAAPAPAPAPAPALSLFPAAAESGGLIQVPQPRLARAAEPMKPRVAAPAAAFRFGLCSMICERRRTILSLATIRNATPSVLRSLLMLTGEAKRTLTELTR